MAKFGQYNLKANILSAIDKLGFKEMTDIQKSVIPTALKGRSVVGKAQTGSGKTHAFLIPIFNMIEPSEQKVQAVITVPTRELAMQIYEVARVFNELSGTDLKISLVTGGTDKNKQSNSFERALPQIVIGTPGRIKDLFINENTLNIATAKISVIDEADMIIDLGFIEDVNDYTVKLDENIQTMIYSATIPENLIPFIKKWTINSAFFEIEPNVATAKNVEHNLIKTKHRDKHKVLKELVQSFDPYICMVFVNKREDVDVAFKVINDLGYSVGRIHGGLQPRERKQTLKKANNLEYKFIVATDVAARGIDIDGVSHVISLSLPTDLSYYIHRAGRTGRGKYTGNSFVMYETAEENSIALLKKMGIEFSFKKMESGQLKDAKVIVKKQNNKPLDDDVVKLINKSNAKAAKKGVKPGYKKSRQEQIKRVNRKKRRENIKASIKQQKKVRAIKKQRELDDVDWK